MTTRPHPAPARDPAPGRAPAWPRCGHGADPDSPAGCPGRRLDVTPRPACLAHLDDAGRARYLDALRPGKNLDLRGTRLTEADLAAVLRRFADPPAGRLWLGTVRFDGAVLDGDAPFDGAHITGSAAFHGAAIRGAARFDRARITGLVGFDGAEIAGPADFTGAQLESGVHFDRARIGGHAAFTGVRMADHVSFTDARVAGEASFNGAEFGGNAGFLGLRAADAWFDRCQVAGTAWFVGAQIAGSLRFAAARIEGEGRFGRMRIGSRTTFDDTEIGGYASFRQTEFGGHARFGDTRFGGDVRFDGARFGPDGVRFRRAEFARTAQLGPLVCAGELDLCESAFRGTAEVAAAAVTVRAERTRWAAPAALRLRHAAVDLSDAVLEFPMSVSTHPRPFVYPDEPLPEDALATRADGGADGGTDGDGTGDAGTQDGDGPAAVRLTSLRGVDAAHLVLTDLDLTETRFAGTIHLDQLRLEGRCALATTPTGLRRRRTGPVRWPVRWSPRRTLAEEHHWRAARDRAPDGWRPAPGGVDALEPAALAPLYRHLRKTFEDGKNEPGAADFYYGEMEMRRHDPHTPRAERGLLAAYWALSGYGLRAARALGWLLAAMAATVVAMMVWGLAKDDPRPRTTGTLTGDRIVLDTEAPPPANPDGPPGERLTGERFEKSLQVVVNSVVFRSSGQDLTTTGTYVEMAARFSQPVLLGLAVLAVRGRVKR